MQGSSGYKSLKDGEMFTVDLSYNYIESNQLHELVRLLDSLPQLALDLSANSFAWAELKDILNSTVGAKGFRQVCNRTKFMAHGNGYSKPL